MSSFPPTIPPSTQDAPLAEPAPLSQLAFLRHAARDIFATALAASSIENAFARKVILDGSTLRFDDEVFDLESYDRVRVLAVGKAATPMLEALLRRLPLRAGCDLAGILATPQTPACLPPGFIHFASDHPLPNQASLDAAQAARAMLAALPSDPYPVHRTLCIFLISGGASAMMEEPLDATIPLEDMQAFYRALIHSGASIAEINCVRKHFSAIKGGRLALAAPRGTPLLAFFVSDVPSNQLADLGSGPVLPDPTTVEQCRAVLEHYALLPQFQGSQFSGPQSPASVQHFFNQRFLPETPKPGMFPLSLCTLLDANDLVEAARIRAIELGFRVEVDNACDDWEYMAAARYLLERLQALQEPVPPDSKLHAPEQEPPQRQPKFVCMLSAGEVAVPVEEPCGVGGRNQQWALYAATQMKSPDAPIVVLSAGSDGVDGNSPAAGALVDTETLSRAAQLGLDAEHTLASFNAFPLFDALGDTVMTGPTGNNLRDLRILLTPAQEVVPPPVRPAPAKPQRKPRKPRSKPQGR